MNPYRSCTLCPNLCRLDRSSGEYGICGEGDTMRIAFAGVHRGEEPVLTGLEAGFSGSGTIFFSGCTLGCHDCQNCQLSSDHMGRLVDIEEFAAICLKLQRRGAANINLVTGTHFIPSIREGLILAKSSGLSIPIVWNTSSYELPEALELLSPLIDIYLADLKSLSPSLSEKLCGRRGYFRAAASAILYMLRVQPEVRYDPSGVMVSGVLLRHLVLPGRMKNTESVLRWYVQHADRALVSIMVQFIDMRDPGDGERVTREEYDMLLESLDELGIEDGFLQELGSEEPWVPDFDRQNPFPGSFCDPVWHWED